MICRTIEELQLVPGAKPSVIVGGGTVGIYLAVELAKLGREVVVIEAGNEQLDNFGENSFESVGRPHATIKIGRSRSLGGTSNLWGGQLVEFQPIDFEGREWLPHSKWPVSYGDLSRYHAETYENLGMPVRFLDDRDVFKHLQTPVPHFEGGVELFLTRWMRLPSLAATFRERLESDPRIKVLLNHTVVAMDGKGGRLTGLELVSDQGARKTIEVGEVVLAAGTFENVRLMLHAAHSASWACPWSDNRNLGLFFQDHLGGRVGSVQTIDRKRFLDLFTTIVLGGYRFLPKLRLDNDRLRGERLLNIHAMMFCESSVSENMVFLRQFMKAVIYGRKTGSAGDLFRHAVACGKHLPPLMWRYMVANRVFVPSGSKISMQVQAEQCPVAESRITVDRDHPDSFGLPKVRLDWRIGSEEFQSIREFSLRVRNALRKAGLAEVKFLPGLEEGSQDFINQLRDHNHHAGGTCMGWSAKDGVVDKDLRVFGTENVYVLGASVFRTTSNANTTFLALCFATRMAQLLAKERRNVSQANAAN
jgi:choline dehydrogenase-like flavoprotein